MIILATGGFLLATLPITGSALEKMSEAEMRAVTGKSGFIDSKQDRKKLQSAQNQFADLITSQGLEGFLPENARENLLGNTDLKPEKRARLLQKTTRSLLTNPKFLKHVEQAGHALVELSKAFRKLRGLR
jgi:hypothetical protein